MANSTANGWVFGLVNMIDSHPRDPNKPFKGGVKKRNNFASIKHIKVIRMNPIKYLTEPWQEINPTIISALLGMTIIFSMFPIIALFELIQLIIPLLLAAHSYNKRQSTWGYALWFIGSYFVIDIILALFAGWFL